MVEQLRIDVSTLFAPAFSAMTSLAKRSVRNRFGQQET